jgi:phage shock protein PspC (stress-responsive transcriptional regulator)
MKETINANIGGVAFTLDTDAYARLSAYLDDVRSRVSDPDEVMNDIEARFGEIFRETLTSPMMVVSIDTVEAAIERMGSPEVFGPQRSQESKEQQADPHTTTKHCRLERKYNDRLLAGVCSGLAAYFGISSVAMRLIMLALFWIGLPLIVYIILWIVMPEEKVDFFNTNKKTE